MGGKKTRVLIFLIVGCALCFIAGAILGVENFTREYVVGCFVVGGIVITGLFGIVFLTIIELEFDLEERIKRIEKEKYHAES